MNSYPEEKWELVAIVNGALQAELLRGLLEAQDIRVLLSQEGAGRAYGINVGPLGEIKILVPTKKLNLAKRILDRYYSGELEEETETDSDGNENEKRKPNKHDGVNDFLGS
jgi:hypothetical protein